MTHFIMSPVQVVGFVVTYVIQQSIHTFVMNFLHVKEKRAMKDKIPWIGSVDASSCNFVMITFVVNLASAIVAKQAGSQTNNIEKNSTVKFNNGPLLILGKEGTI